MAQGYAFLWSSLLLRKAAYVPGKRGAVEHGFQFSSELFAFNLTP